VASNSGDQNGLGAFVLKCGAIAGSISAVIGLLTWVAHLKPKPPEGPQSVGVTISSAKIDDIRGEEAVVKFTAKIDGYRNQSLSIWWTLYDAKTRHQVFVPHLGPHDRLRGGTINPTAQDFQGNEQFNVEVPFGGTFFVRVDIADDAKEKTLASQDTGVFEVPR
jgi:hypothetical protein